MAQQRKGRTRARATAKDVALAAGVSISAVSRTFTEGASVSEKTRKKVQRAAKRLGYRPNALARSLMTQRSELIGLISTNFHNPAFMEVFDRFTLGLQDRHLRPLIFNLKGGMRLEDALDLLIEYQVDGVIIASSTMPEGFAETCLESGLPTVIAFGRGPDASALSSVSADNVGGGRAAADCLLAAGRKRLGFIGGPPQATTTADRLRGLRERLREHGLDAATVMASEYAHAEGMAMAGRLLDAHPDIDGIFCGDDVLAMGAADHIRTQRGLRIPEDIGIIGFNDIPMARWPAYDLSTIRQPIDAIIANAIDLVRAHIAEPGFPSQARLLQCEPVIRGTLHAPRIVIPEGPPGDLDRD